MKKLNQKRGGFTLIELLIVVSIIGILSVALVPNLSGAPARARDAARKAMLSEVAAAVETYNIDLGDYPDGDACITADGLTGAAGSPTVRGGDLDALVTTYLNGIPPTQNPVTGLGTDGSVNPECANSVHYTRLDGGYMLFVPLEANRGGAYDIVYLQDIVADGTTPALVVSTNSTVSGTGNAHALVR